MPESCGLGAAALHRTFELCVGKVDYAANAGHDD